MRKLAPTRPRRPSEEGYVLVAVIFMLAIFTIALAVALPKVSKEIQRDRELETMQRGKQYARAVKLYYAQFGAYPPNLDALVKTNNVRFLRKKYKDPTTGKDVWKPVLFGQNKAPTAMGFFGQPLAGSTVAGTGPSGGNGIAGASPAGGASAIGGSPLSGSSSLGAGSDSSSSTDSSAGAAASSTDSSGASSTSASGTSTSPSGGGASSTGTGTGSASSTGLGGQTFGGAGIIGFSPNSPKQSILVYKKKNHYNEWEFVYDPLADQMTQGGNTGGIGQPAGSMSGSSAIGSSTFGSSTIGSPSTGSSGSASSPAAATTTTTQP